jgi:hypothetical protein
LDVPTSSATRTASISTAPLPVIRHARSRRRAGPTWAFIDPIGVRPIVADAARWCWQATTGARRPRRDPGASRAAGAAGAPAEGKSSDDRSPAATPGPGRFARSRRRRRPGGGEVKRRPVSRLLNPRDVPRRRKPGRR